MPNTEYLSAEDEDLTRDLRSKGVHYRAYVCVGRIRVAFISGIRHLLPVVTGVSGHRSVFHKVACHALNCVLQKHVAALASGTCDWNFTWKLGLCRRDQVKRTLYWNGVDSDPIRLMYF